MNIKRNVRHVGSLKFTLAWFLIFASAVLYVSSSVACSCSFRTVADELAASDAVFSGNVTHIYIVGPSGTGQGFRMEVTLRLQGCWKGALGDTVVVQTSIDTGACGYPFKLNEEYLVYARFGARPGEYGTHLCTRTQVLRAAAPDIKALGPSSCPVAVKTRTWSSVKRHYR